MRTFRQPSETDQRWLRFADGILDAVLPLPENSAVQEFGADYVLTIDRDELGVERVRENPLREADPAMTTRTPRPG